MNKGIKKAQEELEKWLSHPQELGNKPTKIKFTNQFVTDDGRKCVIFKYKKYIFGKWLLGIVSDSGTYSEMLEYNEETEIEDAKKLMDILANYWKDLVKEVK